MINIKNAYIQVIMVIHICNGLLGGYTLDSNNNSKIIELGLSIDFNIYIVGSSFIE